MTRHSFDRADVQAQRIIHFKSNGAKFTPHDGRLTGGGIFDPAKSTGILWTEQISYCGRAAQGAHFGRIIPEIINKFFLECTARIGAYYIECHDSAI
jgi:hypothetical protein